ncbi:MAG: hypothetical protein VST66_05240 [Nitrospirota bacterium]|nr:hypothetical protein [Nitrospirota bacterium]
MTGTKTRAKWIGGLLAGCLLLLAPEWAVQAAEDSPTPPAPINPWPNLVQQADALGLPTGCLKEIDPDFVKVEFEDLHTYAAEYHPEHHRMILNLRLSFNKAGGALTDLEKMTHHDLSLLYHELLHAYLDFLFFGAGPDTLTPEAKRVLGLANEQLRCQYRFIRINPIRQRREVTELRFLSKEDAWEVLNETWGVFVGWAVWTKLELYRTPESVGQWTAPLMDEWAQRLASANQSGELLGYYEPDDPEERKVARKRYVAPSHGITPEGAKLLLELILEEPQELVNRSGKVIETTQNTSAEPLPCN